MMTFLNQIRIVIVTLLLLAPGASSIFSQELPSTSGAPVRQQGTTTRKVTTRTVVLDVVMTDAHGNPIKRILSKDDFEVFEDKQQQHIRSFETPAEHLMPPGDQAIVHSAADLKLIGDAPVTILVLDELNSRFEDMAYVRDMMIKYLHSQTAVLQQPTLLLVATNTTMQQLHDWTPEPR
jgi:VWFA-related protein